jgi:hypothetical protein
MGEGLPPRELVVEGKDLVAGIKHAIARAEAECDKPLIAGEDIKEHDVPCFVYLDGDKVYKVPRK